MPYTHVITFVSVVYSITQRDGGEGEADKQIKLVKKLSPHREALRSLINIAG